MNPLYRLLAIAAVCVGLYGSGFLHATIRFWNTAELATTRAERDAANANIALIRSAADAAGERTDKLEAMNAFLKVRVNDYEKRLVTPALPACPGVARCDALTGDDARRLRDIAGARPRP